MSGLRSMGLLLILALSTPAGSALAGDPAVVEPMQLTEPDTGPPAPDRSAPPEVRPPSPMDLGEPVAVELGSGARLLHARVEGVRRVQVIVSFHRGTQDLPPEQVDTARLLSDQWSGSSSRYSPLELELALDRQEAWIDSWADVHDTGMRLDVARDNLDQAVELMRTVLLEPEFDRRELKRSQRETRLWLEQEAVWNTGTVASRALHFGWMPANHPRGRRPDLASHGAVRTAQLEAMVAELRGSAAVTVLVVGDVGQERAENLARILVADLGGQAQSGESVGLAGRQGTRILAIDHPGEQASVRLRLAAPHRDHPDMSGFSAAAFALAGPFGGRLNKDLREDRGWTYGVDAGYAVYSEYGYWQLAVDVPAERVSETLDVVEAHLARIVDEGVTGDEIDACWKDEVAWWNRRRQSASSAGGFYQRRMDLGEDVATARGRVDAMAGVRPADVRAAARTWLGEDAGRLIVVVGPRDRLEGQLAGLDVDWVSAYDAVFGAL